MRPIAKELDLAMPIEICSALLHRNLLEESSRVRPFDIPLVGDPDIKYYVGKRMTCVVSHDPLSILECEEYLLEGCLYLYTANMRLADNGEQFVCGSPLAQPDIRFLEKDPIEDQDMPMENEYTVNVQRRLTTVFKNGSEQPPDDTPITGVRLPRFLRPLLEHRPRVKSARSARSESD